MNGKKNVLIALFLLIIVLIIIFIVIANQGDDDQEGENVESNWNHILYSYGLFSDEPMNQDMENNIAINTKVTGLTHHIIDKHELQSDLEIVERDIPGVISAYKKIPRGVSRSDMARIVSLYVRGGHYADLDVEFLRPVKIKKNAVIVYTELFSPIDKHRIRIANYALSGPPQHPFFKAVLEEMIIRINRNSKEKWHDTDVLNTTGPDVVTSIYHENRQKWRKNESRVLRMSWMKSRSILSHKCAGSWRGAKDKVKMLLKSFRR
jgi:mannosyltransferase OCH1-like enzyme